VHVLGRPTCGASQCSLSRPNPKQNLVQSLEIYRNNLMPAFVGAYKTKSQAPYLPSYLCRPPPREKTCRGLAKPLRSVLASATIEPQSRHREILEIGLGNFTTTPAVHPWSSQGGSVYVATSIARWSRVSASGPQHIVTRSPCCISAGKKLPR
jgi:hypothetical protein